MFIQLILVFIKSTRQVHLFVLVGLRRLRMYESFESIVVTVCDSCLSIGNEVCLNLFRGFIFLTSIYPAYFEMTPLTIQAHQLTYQFLLYLINPHLDYAYHWSIFQTVLNLLAFSKLRLNWLMNQFSFAFIMD